MEKVINPHISFIFSTWGFPCACAKTESEAEEEVGEGAAKERDFEGLVSFRCTGLPFR